MQVTNPIIPTKQTEVFVDSEAGLDLKAICIFSAVGFFLDDDTYWTHKKVLRPSTVSTINSNNKLKISKSYFNWHYSPRSISFHDALEEYTVLFEAILKKQTEGERVVLPLSGGLDSRTQACGFEYLKSDVFSYSYEFQNGYPETKIAQQIAKVCDFQFESYTIKEGYIWQKLGELARLNNCYTDFTNPRQMAIVDEFDKMGDVFSLGHWGDVLFDNYNLSDLSHDEQVQFLIKMLVKRGGMELAEMLWKVWSLEGKFKDYFISRLSNALGTIDIKNTNARLRAFKSKYWAPRWTSVNLSIFEHYKPITLPYYDNRMCEFICTVPEAYLSNRQLQIAYIKNRSPKLAQLVWQDHRPYNLYNYKNNKSPNNLPYRIKQKVSRNLNALLGQEYIQRNWELQFSGKDNRACLEKSIYDTNLKDWIPETLITNYISAFYDNDKLKNAHAINMLLVLAKWHKNFKN